jgi:hypothetical protein
MSIITFISNIRSNFFKSNKMTPILDEYEPDLEAGEGLYYKKLKTELEVNMVELNNSFELDIITLNLNALYDLEMGDKRIIYEDTLIEDNNISLTNIINYFITSIEL